MKNFKLLTITGLLLSTLLFVGCNNSGEKTFKSSLSFAGSSTLAPVIDAERESFSSNNTKTWNDINNDFPKEEIKMTVTSGGSGEGIKAVVDKTADFGLVSRDISESEKEKIKNFSQYKIGTDALTIAVNPNNKILDYTKNLSSEQIKKIFSGEYKYWSDLNSKLPKKEIVVVTRDLSGGAHKVFQKIIMGDTPVKKDVVQAPSMGALVTKIMENEYAIGYASYGLVNQNKGKITPLEVDNIAPTKENIVSGKYKISRPLLIIKSGNLSSSEKSFIDFILSKEGQSIVEKLGFIPEK